jgi:DNA modification methylase
MKTSAKAIEDVPIADLKPAARNARTHSERQIGLIAKSIETFGFTSPVLIDESLNVIAGHGRIAAARKLGWTKVPCLQLASMTEDEKRAYLIADNRLAERAGWDREILAIEFQVLLDHHFDVEVMGFEPVEMDLILTQEDEARTDAPTQPEDEIPGQDPGAAVTQPGDLWQLGRHLLLCGDARDQASFHRLLGDVHADMAFADPPYNVPIHGHVSGLGATRHREFAVASGEMSSPAFAEFLTATLGNTSAACRDGAIAFICMDWRHLAELEAAGRTAFSELKNLCVWTKTNGGMGTFYRSKHELIFVWKVGTAPHINTFGLGDKGRYRTNVWSYAGVNTFKAERMEEISSHPTVKPVALVADAIRDVTHRGHVVLDPFGGSGTTLIAAHTTGRTARLMEIDPVYCDVTIRRFEKLTGKAATLSGSGETFEQVSCKRRSLAEPSGPPNSAFPPPEAFAHLPAQSGGAK